MTIDPPEPALRPPMKRRIGARFRTYFFTGIIVTAPIGLTIYLTWTLIDYVDSKVKILLPEAYHPDRFLPFTVPGLGLLAVIAGLVLVGFLTANFVGRSLLRLGERLVGRMPVIRSIYSALKQLFETVLAQSSNSFRQVVAVEFPRQGMWAVAFLTSDSGGEIASKTGEDMVTVFLPTAPNPTSGYLVCVPRSQVLFLDMSVEDAMKLVVSGGMVAPPSQANG